MSAARGPTTIRKTSARGVWTDRCVAYTRGLLAANLHGAAKRARLDAIPGAPPSLETPPAACPFAPRCAQARDLCRAGPPPVATPGPGRRVACVLETAAP